MSICPYCSNSGEFWLKSYKRHYHICRICGLIFLHRNLTYNDTLSIYQKQYFDNYAIDQTKGLRNRLFERILKMIGKRKAPGRLLDVGAGCGYFLALAEKKGWAAEGVEPSAKSSEYAIRLLGVKVYQGALGGYAPRSKFDVVTFINVLEHSAAPWDEIEKSIRLLDKDGFIVIRCTNGFTHTLLYKIAAIFGLQARIRPYLVFHQYCLTPKYLKKLLTEKGFNKVSISNSTPTTGDPNRMFEGHSRASAIKIAVYVFAQFVYIVTLGTICVGASLNIIAYGREK